jgi:hypothetical protein
VAILVLTHRSPFLLCLVTTVTSGCVAGFGATAGVTVDVSGNVALMARGWAHGGTRLNKEKSSDKTAEWGMPILTQLELGAGYDVTRSALRLEFAYPFIGFVRAPLDANGEVISGQLGIRLAVNLLGKHPSRYWTGQIFASFSVAWVQALRTGASKRSDWDGPREYDTVGFRIEPGIGLGSSWGSIYVGPAYERLNFYNIYLSEGPEPDGGPESPP